jgi:hypothetical protein
MAIVSIYLQILPSFCFMRADGSNCVKFVLIPISGNQVDQQTSWGVVKITPLSAYGTVADIYGPGKMYC